MKFLRLLCLAVLPGILSVGYAAEKEVKHTNGAGYRLPQEMKDAYLDLTPSLLSLPAPEVTQIQMEDPFQQEFFAFNTLISQATQAWPDEVTPIIERLRKGIIALPEALQKKVRELLEVFHPQELLIEGHKLAFLETMSCTTHPCLNPLNARVQNIYVLETDPLLISIKEDLIALREQYIAYQQRLCAASPAQRRALFSRVRIQGDWLRSYFISEETAYRILSTDLYALPKRTTEGGSSPVIGVGGVHFKRNIRKGAAGVFTLNPSMEWTMYAFHQFLLGEGIPPSALLVVSHVPHKVPQEGTTAHEAFREAADRNTAEMNRRTAEEILSDRPQLQRDLRDTTQTYVVQASRTARGVTLGKFLEDKGNMEDIDMASFSTLMIGSLLINPADGKPDNYVVEEILPRVDRPRYRLESVDNDWALANMIVQTEGGSRHHFLESKTILYCLQSLMQKPIHESIRAKLLTHSPDVFMVRWLTALKQQNDRYDQLLQQGVLEKAVYDGLSLPLRFCPGMVVMIRDKFAKVQQTLMKGPSLSHQDLFDHLYPLVACYYETLSHESKESLLNVFRDVYSQHRKTAFENVLLPDRVIVDQQVREHLQGERALAGTYRNRTQSLEETIRELLETVDLTTQSSQVISNLLDLVVAHWPIQAQKMKQQSWYQYDLLHQVLPHNPSLALVDFLLGRLPRKHINAPYKKCTLLHLAIMHGRHQARAILQRVIEKGADLEVQDGDESTPLDHVMKRTDHGLFAFLIEQGAGQQVSPEMSYLYSRTLTPSVYLQIDADTSGRCFFQMHVPDNPAYSAFSVLLQRNLPMAWHTALETILPQGHEGYAVHCATFGKRVLPESLKPQLINSQNQIIPYTKEKRRRVVGRVEGSLSHIYFKVYPELPGLEEAVGVLTRTILGWGAPYTELMRINDLPVLASYGIQGRTLKDVLEDDPNTLNQLDPESISSMILMAMITNPEDGKPDNYIVEEILPRRSHPRYRLIGIDNDHAFMPAVAKEPEKKRGASQAQPVVQVKTILYCLDQMNDPIHPGTRQRFLDLNVGEVLEAWVKELGIRNSAYRKLFAIPEVQAFLEKNCYIGVPFEKGAIERLYDKMVRLQRHLQLKPTMTHMELLTEIEPHLAYRYRKSFPQFKTVFERFRGIDGSFYGPQGETMTTSVMLLKDINIPLKESLLETVRSDQVEAVDYRPSMALQTLREIRDQHAGLLLLQSSLRPGGKVDSRKMKDLRVDAHLVDLLRDLDFRTILKPDQEAILQTLQGRPLRSLMLKNISALTDTLLTSNLRFENLTTLRLKGCTQITSSLLSALAHPTTGAKVLTTLTLKGSDRLTEVGEWRLLAAPSQITFERLERLNVQNCPNLTVINLMAPSLRRLNASGCINLKDVEVDSKNLQMIKLNGTAVTNMVVLQLLAQNFLLQKIELQGCGKIANEVQKFGENPKSTSLSLERLSVGDIGANTVSKILKTNITLTILNLSKNWITAAGFKAISEALKTNTTLTSLDLSANHLGFSTGNAGCVAIAEALKANSNSSLSKLDLGFNSIWNEGGMALGETLETNTTLTWLDLRNNNIGDAGGDAIIKALKTNTTITDLVLGFNHISTAKYSTISDAVFRNKMKRDFYD